MKVYPDLLIIIDQSLSSANLSILIIRFKSWIWTSFKVSVMAEILTQVQIGVGKQLSFDRNMLDMTGIFAWTIWIIIISLLVENIFSWSLKTSKIEDQKKSQ